MLRRAERHQQGLGYAAQRLALVDVRYISFLRGSCETEQIRFMRSPGRPAGPGPCVRGASREGIGRSS